jgi:5-methylcytosine-specific restriction protein A
MKPGDILSNDELMSKFDVGLMGGMRRSTKNNCLVIVSDSTKGLYDDRWEGPTLHYTGMGKVALRDKD